MRGVELTIAIGSALGLLLMMVADAAQQRMGVAPPPTTISVEENIRPPAVAPANCVPGGEDAEQSVWTAAVDAACSAAPVSNKGKVG